MHIALPCFCNRAAGNNQLDGHRHIPHAAAFWWLQTGKSYFLSRVLPAIVAQHKAFKDKPVTVMCLTFEDMPVQEVSARPMLNPACKQDAAVLQVQSTCTVSSDTVKKQSMM